MEETSSVYIPSGLNPSQVIQSLNDCIPQEIACPGAWSSTLFFNDLKEYPAKSKFDLANLVDSANKAQMTYLDFFQKSRGTERKVTDQQKRILEIFEKGSVMLYFEFLFLRFFNGLVSEDTKLSKNDEILLLYIQALSSCTITQWDSIVKGIGAICFQFFAKEPDLYVELLGKPVRGDQPTDMTDQELLQKLSGTLSPTSYRGKISINDSRSELIKQYQAIIK